MKRHIIVTLVVLYLGLTGCSVVHSKNPISEASEGSADLGLVGVWEGKKNSNVQVHISKINAKFLRIVFSGHDDKGRFQQLSYIGHTSYINGKKYLNLYGNYNQTHSKNEVDNKSYVFILYELKLPRCSLKLVMFGYDYKARNTGKLKVKNNMLYDSSKNIRKYIIDGGSVKLDEAQTLVKIRD